ncbi:MAG: RNA polymerase factor sigma-32 [Candidatus Binatia bacterium]|nr:RNA polymerase factor sigma-32 [Candidatus Binatia bacterium]
MKRPPRKGAARPKKEAARPDDEPVVVEAEPVDGLELREPSADPVILEAEIVDPVGDDAERVGRASGAEAAESTGDDDGADGDPKVASADVSEDRYGSLVPADALQRYLAEIRRHPLLDPDEEHELAVRWVEHGDREAAAELVTANLRLVVMMARKYQKAFKNLLDLVQEGNIGLLEAVKKFDPYRGVRFPSYAVYWIRAYIIRYVMNNWRVVKLGTTQAQRKLFFNLQREKEKLEREGYTPDPALIAERLSVKPQEVIEMEQRLSGRDVSVDAPVGDDGDSSMLDFLPDGSAQPEEEFGEGELRSMIQQRIREFGDTLEDKERVIFDQRMISDEPKTLQELGEVYGVSRERIRQIEERIKRRLRAYLVEQIPDIADVDVRMPLSDRRS